MLKIIIDDRERQPWNFGEFAEVSRGRLTAGDYALDGDTGFAVERKSLDDYVGTVSSGWKNFVAEMERMKKLDFPCRAVIVEANWEEVIQGKYNHPKVQPHFILKRTAELTMRGVSVFFASNPTMAAGMAWKLLQLRREEIENDSEDQD